MFERFTNNSRRALVVAQDEARSAGHRTIQPEHLLIGLRTGGGLAGVAMAEVGIDVDGLRQRVAAAFDSTDDGRKVDKVPFSPRAKKSLELALREAIRLGHNHIGTEHLLLGVLRQDERDDEGKSGGRGGQDGRDRGRTAVVLGVEPDRLWNHLMVLMSDPPASAPLSPALVDAMARSRQLAGDGNPVTTGHLLDAVVADPSSQAAVALAAVGITADAVRGAVADVPVAGTSDAPPPPRAVELTLGSLSVTIDDPDLVARLDGLSAEDLVAALRRSLGGTSSTDEPSAG